MKESAYPYLATQQATCNYDINNATNINVVSIAQVTQNSAPALKQALATGPVSVAIEAGGIYFQSYQSGILDDAAQCGTALDHAVLAVGWGVENGQEYWLIKNSWNSNWGDKGYIKIAIVDGPGICGVQMDPTYPVM